MTKRLLFFPLFCFLSLLLPVANASATKLATRIAPNHVPKSIGDKMVGSFYSSSNPSQKDINYFMTTTGLDDSSPLAIGAQIFTQALGDGNLWMVQIKDNTKYPWRLLFSQYGSRIDQTGESSLSFSLADSGIKDADGKWKVNAIGLTCWNLRVENGKLASQSPNIPCAINVNGINVELDNIASEQYVICEFPEEQQWIDTLELMAKMDAAVGVSKIVFYIDDVEGFNSSDSNADKLLYSEDGIYTIAAPFTGSLDFSSALTLALLDSEGNPVDYSAENNGDGTFTLKRKSSFAKVLPPAKYLACYIVDDNDKMLRSDAGIPFEIVTDINDDGVLELSEDGAQVEYFSLDGVRVLNPGVGPIIRLKIYDNGNRKAEKVIL